MDAPITLLLIAATCVVSLIALRTPSLLMRLILWPPAIDRHRQYDRLVAYGFIHADIWHLFFNMFTLFFFGRQIEAWMAAQHGPWVFPLFYFSALVVSILPTYLKHQKDPNYRSLGASGAVSAVLNAIFLGLAVAVWRNTASAFDFGAKVGGKRPWLDQITLPLTMRRFGFAHKIVDERNNCSISNDRRLDGLNPAILHYHRSGFLRNWPDYGDLISAMLDRLPQHRAALTNWLTQGGYLGDPQPEPDAAEGEDHG